MFLKLLKTTTTIIIIIVIIIVTHCLIIYMAIALLRGLVAKIILVLLTLSLLHCRCVSVLWTLVAFRVVGHCHCHHQMHVQCLQKARH